MIVWQHLEIKMLFPRLDGQLVCQEYFITHNACQIILKNIITEQHTFKILHHLKHEGN